MPPEPTPPTEAIGDAQPESTQRVLHPQSETVNTSQSFLPQSPQEFVSFTIFCLRQLAVTPTPELRAQVKTLFLTARSVVNPVAALPGWILNVGVACFSTLVAEGETQAALRSIDELAVLDAEIGGNALQAAPLREAFETLRSEAIKMACGLPQ